MTLGQRFLRYFIGVAIGCVVVYMMFPNYDWLGWTPKKQIIKQMSEAKMDITPHAICRLNCLGLTSQHFEEARKNGEVDLSRSNPQATPRQYLIQFNNEEYLVLLTDSVATLAEVMFASGRTDCNCE